MIMQEQNWKKIKNGKRGCVPDSSVIHILPKVVNHLAPSWTQRSLLLCSWTNFWMMYCNVPHGSGGKTIMVLNGKKRDSFYISTETYLNKTSSCLFSIFILDHATVFVWISKIAFLLWLMRYDWNVPLTVH